MPRINEGEIRLQPFLVETNVMWEEFHVGHFSKLSNQRTGTKMIFFCLVTTSAQALFYFC